MLEVIWRFQEPYSRRQNISEGTSADWSFHGSSSSENQQQDVDEEERGLEMTGSHFVFCLRGLKETRPHRRRR